MAFYADAVLLDRVRRIDRDLIAGRVAMLDAEIVIFQLHVQIGQDQLVADQMPDDPGHLIAIEFDDGIGDLDLVHGILGKAWLRDAIASVASKVKAADWGGAAMC